MKHKTYAEVKRRKPFNWNRALARAIAGKASKDFKIKMRKLSGEWVTCACGNQCSALPRTQGGYPEDDKLASLGTDFFEQVRRGRYRRAKKTLENIERRSASLIQMEHIKLEAVKLAKKLGIDNPILF